MTYYDVWITQPEQPVAFFPEGRAAFFVVKEGIEGGRWRGEQTDHLTWRARMTRSEIEALIEEAFGTEGSYEAQYAVGEHLAARMRALRAFVAALPEGEEFPVMADEF
jgi:hypothetical protein